MKKIMTLMVLFSIMILSIGCSGAKERDHVYYRSIRGPSPWWGHRPYYRDHINVVPPDGGGDLEAVLLPEGPPDMGMPDVDMEPFD